MHFIAAIFAIILCSWGATSHAQHAEGGGFAFDVPRLRPAELTRRPEVSFPIPGLDEISQRHVDYALELTHGFWIAEAERHMREAMVRNPSHPLIFALGAFVHTVFGSGDFERGLNYFNQAMVLRQEQAMVLGNREAIWFDAIVALYDNALPSPKLKQEQHLRHLQMLVAEFPEDVEAKAFLALQNWLFRVLDSELAVAEKQRVVAETDQLIRAVLTAAPRHPAHHYKIHLWNNGREEYKALDSARIVGPAQAQTAHLWHMPAHIFNATQDIYYATRHIEAAHRVDHQQMAERRLMPANQHNYYHNFRDFGLRLAGTAGQPSHGIDRALAMLRFGRLPHFGSRASHATLAVGVLQQLEAYQLWERFQVLMNQGYFSDLVTGDLELDRWVQAAILRLQIRAGTHLAASFSTLRPQLESTLIELERLSNEEVVAGVAQRRVVSNFEDARLWFEIALRRNDDHVPAYFIEQLAKTALTPLTQVALLAQQLGEHELALKLMTSAADGAARLGAADALNLAHFAARSPLSGSGEWLPLATARAVRVLTPPLQLADFSGLAIAKEDPGTLTEIIQRAEARHTAERAAYPAGFAYMETLDLATLGPIDPQLPTLTNYQGAAPSAAEHLASPVKGRYKLLVFSAGPACLNCNEQLRRLVAMQETLGKYRVDTVAVTATGETVNALPTVPDADQSIHHMFGVFDEFEEVPLHGIFLMDDERRILWHSVTQHAIDDVDFLVAEWGRVLRLTAD